MIQLDDERDWLYAAVDPDSKELLHTKLETTRTNAFTVMFFAELREKHDVDDAVCLVDGAPHLQEVRNRYGLEFRQIRHGDPNSVERVLQESKRRTNQLSNCFRNATKATADEWLRRFAFVWDQLI